MDMKDMSKDEIKDKKLDILLSFMGDRINKLEGKQQEGDSQEDLAKPYVSPRYFKKEGKGLKIMTPNQLLTRLPILSAQKKAGNNSQKLNNEIRQIIYSLYSSKNMSKTVYNHLMSSL